MTPKATPRCSCGGKMKTGGALSDHLRDSPKHKPLIKGKVVPMPVNLQTKPGTSVLVNNMTIFHVVSAYLSMNKHKPMADRHNEDQLYPASC